MIAVHIGKANHLTITTLYVITFTPRSIGDGGSRLSCAVLADGCVEFLPLDARTYSEGSPSEHAAVASVLPVWGGGFAQAPADQG